jgi:hypothetical protein
VLGVVSVVVELAEMGEVFHAVVGFVVVEVRHGQDDLDGLTHSGEELLSINTLPRVLIEKFVCQFWQATSKRKICPILATANPCAI